MKIVFSGTSEFAFPSLDKLLNSSHQILAVYTKPDKPAGRGLKVTATPVKQYAVDHKLKLVQPLSLRNAAAQEELAKFGADVIIDVACGFYIPKEVIDMPRFGCVNIHPSLLPRWRGAAPIERAMLAGDKETGVTIMRIDEGLDTGPVFLQQSVPIAKHASAGEMRALLAEIGAEMLLHVLDLLEQDKIAAKPQDDSLATYAEKLTKEEAAIEWHKSALEIDRMVRAYNPWPVAFVKIGNIDGVRIWESSPLTENPGAEHEPGTVLRAEKDGIDIRCGNKTALRILKMQFPGGKILPVSEILKSRQKMFAVGAKL